MDLFLKTCFSAHIGIRGTRHHLSAYRLIVGISQPRSRDWDSWKEEYSCSLLISWQMLKLVKAELTMSSSGQNLGIAMRNNLLSVSIQGHMGCGFWHWQHAQSTTSRGGNRRGLAAGTQSTSLNAPSLEYLPAFTPHLTYRQVSMVSTEHMGWYSCMTH